MTNKNYSWSYLEQDDDYEEVERHPEEVHDCRSCVFRDIFSSQGAQAREVQTAADLKYQESEEDDVCVLVVEDCEH